MSKTKQMEAARRVLAVLESRAKSLGLDPECIYFHNHHELRASDLRTLCAAADPAKEAVYRAAVRLSKVCGGQHWTPTTRKHLLMVLRAVERALGKA